MLKKHRIYISDVVSHTSEDTEYKAENMKKGLHPWTCSKEDKSGRLEGEFVLDCMTSIYNIQVGNFNSHTLEILVGRSTKSNKRPTKYKTYLPTFTLFSPGSPKKDLQSEFMFTKEHFVKSLYNKMWDKIKIVLTEPTKETQFGVKLFIIYKKAPPPPDYTDLLNLSLKLEEEDEDEIDAEAFYAKNEKYYDDFYKNGPLAFAKSPCTRTLEDPKDYALKFREQATKFLKEKKNSIMYQRFFDFLDDFELEREEPLSLQEKQKFYKMYVSIVGECKYDDKEAIFAKMSAKDDYMDDFYDGLMPKTSDLKELLKKKQESQNLSVTNKTSKTSKKSRPRKRLVKEINASCSKKVASASKLTTSVKKSAPIKSVEKPYVPIDFSAKYSPKVARLVMSMRRFIPENPINEQQNQCIQFDDAVPSTSFGTSFCSICEVRFPLAELATHAAVCGEDSS